MIRQCILHVGTEKTGTTSVQRFMAINHEALRARGWLAPRSLAPHANVGILNHITLAALSRPNQPELDDIDVICGMTADQDKASFIQSAGDRLTAEACTPDNAELGLLFSNEHIHSRLRTTKQLGHLRDFMLQFCGSTKIIVYLRAQWEMARALVNTALRQGVIVRNEVPQFSSADGFDHELWVDRRYFDLHSFVDRLAEVFGDDNLIVRLYPERKKSGTDIIQDFFTQCGIDITALERPPRENTSFDVTSTLFLNLYNEFCRSMPEPVNFIMRERLITYLSVSSPGKGIIASRSKIAEFMAQFDAGNEALRAKWFPSRERLFELDLDQFPESVSHELSAGEVMRKFGQFLSWNGITVQAAFPPG